MLTSSKERKSRNGNIASEHEMAVDEPTQAIKEYFWKKGLGFVLEMTFDNDVHRALSTAFPDLQSEVVLAEGVAGLSEDWKEDSPIITPAADVKQVDGDLTESETQLVWKIEQFRQRGSMWIGLRATTGEEQSEEEYYATYRNYNQDVFDGLGVNVTLRRQGGGRIAHWSADFPTQGVEPSEIPSIVATIVKKHAQEIDRLKNTPRM
jgi:hypothetical protein